MPQFTPTEQRIVDMLSDGLPHSREELVGTIDELATRKNLQVHITRIRNKLRPIGEDVVCEAVSLRYRHVRLISMRE